MSHFCKELSYSAGVGLSYSTDPSDYVTDDYQTAQDLYEGLLTWFEEYTFFANHTFIMSGESYAGQSRTPSLWSPNPKPRKCLAPS